MWQSVLYFIAKVLVGVVVAAWGYEKKQKKVMRQFDNLGTSCKTAVLTDMVALAKAYEAENNTGDSIEQLAVDFGQTYLLTLADFNAINVASVVSWVGPMPPKPPRIV